ncbi:MAG TPA: antibiotic biosynthesis monooxygenase [Stellaceae bacterium]|nr:antibiotic biosynthesis monooxygenase [Stellaceae bacterium]
MRTVLLALVAGVMALASSSQPAPAQTAGVYAITYFDIFSPDFEKAAALLRPFAAATRKEDGNVEFTLLDEVGRGGRMAIVEAWRDKAALDAHGAAVKGLAEKLQPYVAAPFDTRQFVPLSTAAPAADAKLGSAMWVLTHVDVFPAGKDEVAALVKSFAEESRKDKGEERFDVLVWDGHPNHFHLIEAWTDHLAREAHAYAAHTKAFRAKLVPFEGALYDERLYEVVR